MASDAEVTVYEEPEDEGDPNAEIVFDCLYVVGESHYHEAFQKILGRLEKGESLEIEDAVAVLVREPRNKFDSNAIAVHIVDGEGNARKVGYLAEDDADPYVETIKTLERRIRGKVGCVAHIYGERTGGLLSSKEIYSAELDLPDAEEWLSWKKVD